MDRTTTHHNQDTTVPSLQNPPSRIPRPWGVTLRPWPWRPELFQNHSRPGGQRRPLLLPHPPNPPPWPLTLTCPHPAVHQLPPYSPFWSLSVSICGAPRPLPRICAHGVWGVQGGQPGGHPQTWLHPHLGPGGPSDTSPCRRHIQTTQGLHPGHPRWKHFSSHIRKLNQATTAPVAQAPRPQGNGKLSASTSAPW